jgi:Tol biopolymer transport system component
VDGEWIYYSDSADKYRLYKMKTDGSDRTRVSNDTCGYLNVLGDWVYYKNDSQNGKLYKIKTDGTQVKELTDSKSSYINIVEGWVYYMKNVDNKFSPFKIRVDGTDKQGL